MAKAIFPKAQNAAWVKEECDRLNGRWGNVIAICCLPWVPLQVPQQLGL